MKFVKENTASNLTIPATALKLSGFAEKEKVEIHTAPAAVTILKGRMTVMEMIQAIESLSALAGDLTLQLAKIGGPCDGCGGECPFEGGEDYDIDLPDYLREEAGIPADAKLCAYVNEDENLVTIAAADYEHDLRDVPPHLLELLDQCGVCLGELEERIILEDVVYGD